jgi:hypothetical protein
LGFAVPQNAPDDTARQQRGVMASPAQLDTAAWKRVAPSCAWLLISSLLSVGCSSATDLDRSDALDIREFVVGEALADLDRNGQFRLNDPFGREAGVTPGYAQRIAAAVIEQFVLSGVGIPGYDSWRQYLERVHGAPIEWGEATVGARSPYYTYPYLLPLPDSAPASARRFHGPHYLVPVLVGSRQVAVVSVSAFTSTSFDATGRLIDTGDNNVRPTGVRYESPIGLPAAPEEAVRHVASRLAVRVARVPYLLQLGDRIAHSYSQWVLTLERPVRIRLLSSGGRVETNTLYVGEFASFADLHPAPPHTLRVFVADATQPAGELVSYVSDGELRSIVWPLRAGAPVRFLEVDMNAHTQAPNGM